MASTGEVEAGRAFVRLFLKNDMTSRLTLTLKSAGAKLKKFGRIGVAAGGAIVAVLGSAAKQFASFGDQLDKMSLRTGIAVDALSELKFAAEQSGASLNDVGATVLKMNRRFGRVTAGQGSAKQIAAVEELGLSVEQLSGMNAEERFLAFGEAIAQYGDNAAAAGLAQKIFGTGIDALLPMLLQGKDGIAALRKEARELGLVMSREDAAAAAKLTDAMNRSSKAIEAAWLRIGAAVAPIITNLADRVAEVAVKAQEWISANRETVITALKVGAAVAGVGLTLMALGTVANGAAAAVTAVSIALTFLAAHPLVAVAIAIGVAYVAMVKLTSYMPKLSDEMDRALSKGDKMRAQEAARMQELAALAEKQSLTSSEMETAGSIIGELTSKYGDMGIAINETTGAIEGMATAQSQLNDLHREAARADLKAKIAEQQSNIQELSRQQRYDAQILWPHEYGTENEDLERQQKQIDVEMMKLDALLKRYKAVSGGDIGALTGGATSEIPSSIPAGFGEDTTSEQAADMNKRILDQLADYRIALIEDEQQRAIAAVNKRYDAERDKAADLGADLALVAKARRAAIEGIDADFSTQRAKAAKQDTEMRGAKVQAIRDETTRLEITRDKEGMDKALALLKHREKIELRAAANDAERQAIAKKYAAERDVVQQGFAGQTKGAGGATLTATYSAAAARIAGFQAGGGPEKKMADGITEVAKNTKEMTQLQQQFLAGWRVA